MLLTKKQIKKVKKVYNELRLPIIDILTIGMLVWAFISLLPMFTNMLTLLTTILTKNNFSAMSDELKIIYICLGIWVWLQVATWFFWVWNYVINKIRGNEDE